MIWKKDPNKKYTDLCIYIDENMEKLRNPGEYPEIENTIYNYLWLLVKALAIKKCMFKNFADYDPYAFYSARRLFFALRRNLQNQGKTIKGKLIRPIKSCLNYTKALLYPMKIEYQREAFAEVISEEFVSKKFDAFSYKEQLKSEARESQQVNQNFLLYITDIFNHIGILIDRVLVRSPFQKGSDDYRHVKISMLLNCLNILKTNKKLDSNVTTVILWKLPKSMSTYVRILLKEFYSTIKVEIMECYKSADIDDNILENLIENPDKESVSADEE